MPELYLWQARKIVEERLEEGFYEMEINPWIMSEDDLAIIYNNSELTEVLVQHFTYEGFKKLFKKCAKKFREDGCRVNM